jgi:hypothetical protein
VGRGDLGDAIDVGVDAVREADDLDQQRGRGVDRQPGVDVRLDRLQAELVHHLDRGRHHAGGDDAAHRLGAVLDVVEVHQKRAHRRRILCELDADRGGDAEHSLTADERTAQVVPDRLRILTAQHCQRPVWQHDFDGEHV